MMHMTQEALSFPPTLPMGVPVVSGFFEKTRGGLSTQMSFLFVKKGQPGEHKWNGRHVFAGVPNRIIGDVSQAPGWPAELKVKKEVTYYKQW